MQASPLHFEPNLRRRFLIVEDDPDLFPLLLHALQELYPGVTVQWNVDFEGASEALRGGPWDAVITDYAIGGDGTGWRLLQEQRGQHPSTAFGVMSAMPLGIDSDATPFLLKPFSPGELVSFLLRVLPA